MRGWGIYRGRELFTGERVIYRGAIYREGAVTHRSFTLGEEY